MTASSDALWQNVAAGDVAVSFVLGNDGGLPLHSRVSAGQSLHLRVGAYATTGFGAVDAVVSKDIGRSLGLPRDNALIVSAPKADSDVLRKRILARLPKGTQVAMVNPVLPQPKQKVTQNWPAGSFMTGEQLTVALRAAVSKLGRPYVWGAEGPDTFDCSGLVQWAYAQAGVRMPRVTHQQWVTGPQVAYAQAQPGDLLFWRNDPTNPAYISHVAIYWGNGKNAARATYRRRGEDRPGEHPQPGRGRQGQPDRRRQGALRTAQKIHPEEPPRRSTRKIHPEEPPPSSTCKGAASM
ncbi:C40 family peptidase [Nonomuraea salmonea]|uniref:C40 family peptidase n=1 Tax=Nonomuraea salmonea TaxID=46181 RepID=UPI002FECA439